MELSSADLDHVDVVGICEHSGEISDLTKVERETNKMQLF